MTNKELAEQEIENVLLDGHFGKDFKFRDGQRDVITQIIETYLDGDVDTIILDAPTGSGKSVIALFASTVLSHFKKKGYILTSELSLQDQYEKDLKRLNISAAMVKGVDNYDCVLNHQPFSLGECQIRKISPKKMECVNECPYIVKRTAASESSIAVLGYAYWLIQRNYVAPKMDEPLFTKRDFIFFDESHNINKIVQSHLSPNIPKSFYEALESIQNFLVKQKISDHDVTNLQMVKKMLSRLNGTLGKKDTSVLLSEFEFILAQFLSFTAKTKSMAKKKFPQSSDFTNVKLFPQNWTKAMKNLDWIKDIHCKIEDYNKLVVSEGHSNIVRKVEEERTVLNFINESYLVQKHLIAESGFKIYMSATIGDPVEYMKNTGIINAKYIRVDNSFNFEKSPIYFMKGFKMNYQNKDEMVPKLVSYMDIVLSSVEKETKGIIHTGSYDITERIFQQSKHNGRMIVYRGSAEKKEALIEFEKSKNGILVGPSLLEGLDLKDDLSRFQIFFKVPYSSLGDPLVKAKLEHSQSWYNYDVTIKILQGIGRSIRSENDWARTYLMDANFIRVLKSQKLPDHITSRYASLNDLLKNILNKSRK